MRFFDHKKKKNKKNKIIIIIIIISMTTEALALLPCFLDWHVLPRNVYSPSVAAYAGLYSVTILIHPGGIIPIEDCRVFVMRRRVTFNLTCPILFHPIYHSYNHPSQSSIQSYKSCRHSGIHTYTHSCIYNKDNIMRTWLH